MLPFHVVISSSSKLGMNSSTLGRYFLFQLPGLNHRDGHCIARAFSISLAGVSVSLTTAQTTYHTMNRTGTARQNHPAVFRIDNVFLNCTAAGECGTFFLRSGDGDFALDVLGLHDSRNGDAMQVIPVSGYGTQYYLMTLGQRAFLIIMSPSNNNNISFKLKSNTTAALPDRFRSHVGDHFTVMLEREQSYSMYDCQVNQVELTGKPHPGSALRGVKEERGRDSFPPPQYSLSGTE
ncbi:hypothetical protein Btru_044258 [Bulinus truncatus]|nr:hypothetical protein Btru_044258 [Bulinus truncatus]